MLRAAVRQGLRRRRLEVISGLDLDVDAGELVAVVGASGSGKSLLAHALLGVLPSNAVEGGRITYDGALLDAPRRRALRREIALIPQSVTFLDPLAAVGAQAQRAAELARDADPGSAARRAFDRLDLADGVAGRYPHELSGGMARRVLTATATIGTPRLVVADESTPGLHAADLPMRREQRGWVEGRTAGRDSGGPRRAPPLSCQRVSG